MQGRGIKKTESKPKSTGCYAVAVTKSTHTLSDIDGIKAVLLLAVEG